MRRLWVLIMLGCGACGSLGNPKDKSMTAIILIVIIGAAILFSGRKKRSRG
jgi:hypothetical protein